ncbi:MAG: signal peptidase I [Bacilli bacterium]|nr:signal peptidase I [Bacilli bacterium]
MRNILRIILSFITCIFLFLLVCIGFFAFNKDGNFLGFTIYTAGGTSMSPTIENGDILLVRKDPEYKENDIIIYTNDEGMSICHRVIQKKTASYVTKGDNNNFIDGYDPTVDDINGKMVFNVINVKTLNKYKYWLMSLVVIIPIILYIINRCLNVRSDNN